MDRGNPSSYRRLRLRSASVTPASGPTTGGTSITIRGASFQQGAAVSIGGNAATGVTFINATTLSAVTPAHAAGAADVVVRNPDGQSGSLANGFTYSAPAPPPAVSSVTPASGSASGGTTITINGANFQQGAVVSIGGNAATGVVFSSATTLAAVTPAHAAGAADVVVRNPDGQTATLANGFTYSTTPSLTTPNILCFGDSITAGTGSSGGPGGVGAPPGGGIDRLPGTAARSAARAVSQTDADRDKRREAG